LLKRRQPAELAVMQAAPAVFKRLRRFKYQAALDCGALASSGYRRLQSKKKDLADFKIR